MSLQKLDVLGLRNLEPLTIEPGPGLNYFIGPNASGKTSLLESIYLLGRARSFRTSSLNQLIQEGESRLRVSARVRAASLGSIPIGIELARGHRQIHLGGRPVRSSAELFGAFPLLVLQPSGVLLLEGPPKIRRNFLDFGVFLEDPGYLDLWRRYNKALHQRNALLRASRFRDLPAWNHELARYAIMIHESRQHYLDRLVPVFCSVSSRFFKGLTFDVRLIAGWDVECSLFDRLERDAESDARHGHTQSGPHKGDFAIHLDRRPVRGFVSRGQMKVLVYALLLAQSRLMEDRFGDSGCVLIDDVASELDQQNKHTLLELLSGRKTQFFITATERTELNDGQASDAACFQLAQGRIIQAAS